MCGKSEELTKRTSRKGIKVRVTSLLIKVHLDCCKSTMGKRKQKGKSMMMADRERLRLQTNLVGAENQHVVTRDIGNENVR